jgi:hypothetical protein
MIGLVFALALSVAVERLKVNRDCFQDSISAYYYTPVRAIFVGALVALGVCLVCLRGSTPIEDVLLNLAGMLAPVVAFVPTPGYTSSCSSAPIPVEHIAANVANNALVLIVGEGIVLLVVWIEMRKAATVPELVASAVAVVIWLTLMLVYALARHFFVHNAHFPAASVMFVFIVFAAVTNARDTKRASLRMIYGVIAAVMFAALVIIPLVGIIADWHHSTLVVEIVVLALFAAFWVIQTCELWTPGLRSPDQGRSRRDYERKPLRQRITG